MGGEPSVLNFLKIVVYTWLVYVRDIICVISGLCVHVCVEGDFGEIGGEGGDKKDHPPSQYATRFLANFFWMGEETWLVTDS